MEDIEVGARKNKSSLMIVSKSDVAALKDQRKLLREFVTSQLKEADFSDPKSANYGEGDYGIIPGTKNRCLFKQGAEKLQRLFGLGCKFTMVDKEIDKAANFAIFTYKCEVLHPASGNSIAECEASVNSQEKKYKERTVWKTKKRADGTSYRENTTEETPIFDILNTLQKMAQKRALVGATLLATGASEYFTQDLLDPEDVDPKTHGKKEEPPEEKEVEETDLAAPECCGQEMMISKYVDKDFGHKPWFCLKCRSKKPAEGVAS